MENNPLYQGQTATVSSGINYSPLSTAMPGAEEALRNGMQASKTFQMLTDALIERNDDTILRRQENAEKQAAMNLTADLDAGINAQPGTEGSLYDQYGRIDKGAVNALRNKYLEPARYFQKGIVNPLNLKKSQDASSQYQLGVDKMIQTSLLAATRTKQKQVYKESMELARKMGAYDDMRKVNKQQFEAGLISENEAAYTDIEIDETEWLDKMQSFSGNPQGFIKDIWDTKKFQNSILKSPKLRKAAERLIDDYEYQGVVEGARYEIDKATGQPKAVKTPALPPPGAPYYWQKHWVDYGGKFDTPEAQMASLPIAARFLSEEIDTPKGTPEGDLQYGRAARMALSIGVPKETFNKMYDTRVQQVSYGGFDGKKYFENIDKGTWLSITKLDEKLDPSLSEDKKEDAIRTIITDLKTEATTQYDTWYTANTVNDKKPSPRDCAEKAGQILRETFSANLEGIVCVVDELTNDLRDVIMPVEKERLATRDRKAKTAAETKKMEGTLVFPKMNNFKLSTDAGFEFVLMRGYKGANLPDSATKRILYLPKHVEIKPEHRKLGVMMQNGKYAFDMEVRHADIPIPVMSQALRAETKTLKRNPEKIFLDRGNLTFSAEDVPVKKVYNGIFPEDETYAEPADEEWDEQEEENTDDGAVPPEQVPWLNEGETEEGTPVADAENVLPIEELEHP